MFPTLKKLSNAGRTLGLKGGKTAVERGAGIHSAAYKKKRKAKAKKAAPARKKAATKKKTATRKAAPAKKKTAARKKR